MKLDNIIKMKGIMKKIFLVFIFTSQVFAKGENQTPKGEISFNEYSFDFGQVLRGTKLKHGFQFTNTGAGPLKIQGVHTACGCTAVEIDKGKEYLPGENGVLELTFDTATFKGNVSKSVSIMTDGAINPNRTITVSTIVHEEFSAHPPIVDFGDFPAGEEKMELVKIIPISGFNLDILKVDFNDQMLTVENKKNPESWELQIKTKSFLPVGFYKEKITVTTNSNSLKELVIPIRFQVQGGIEVSQRYVEFGAISSGTKTLRSIVLNGKQDFEIKSSKAEIIINGKPVTDIAPIINISSLMENSKKNIIAMELMHPENTKGSVHGRVFIETSDPSQKQIAIDIYAFFR